MLLAAGTNHFWHAATYDALIPGFLGPPRPWTVVSGLLELACGLLVAVPRTRRAGGLATAVLLVAVVPGNVMSVLNAETGVGLTLAVLRVPLQIPLVLWALQVRRDA